MQSKKNITELKKIKLFRYQLDEAYQEMQKGKFQAALQKADKVMNEIVKMIIQHEYGIGYTLDNISVNIKICEREQLLGKNKLFVKRLYKVYLICGRYKVNGAEMITEYSNAIVHAFQKFRAPFSGKIVHIFPEQSAVI